MPLCMRMYPKLPLGTTAPPPVLQIILSVVVVSVYELIKFNWVVDLLSSEGRLYVGL